MKELYQYRYQMLAVLFLINTCYFWPGWIMSDSLNQYQQAQLGMYLDHHPPLMSFIWHYLDKIYPGYGTMYLLQQVMFYAAIAILIRIVDLLNNNKELMTLLLLFLPNYPQILIYDVVILKDLQFAFSFMLVAATLAYYTIAQKRPSAVLTISLLMLMLYGAAVKFQGKFVVVFLAVWLGCLLSQSTQVWRKLITGMLLYSLVFIAVIAVNKSLVQETHKQYSWQLVKLYDLAAISIDTQQDLIPNFNKLPSYSFETMQQRFEYPLVDTIALPLIDSDGKVVRKPIIAVTHSQQEMDVLKSVWWHTIVQHPILYLKHRTVNLMYILLSRPGFGYAETETDPQVTKFAIVLDVPFKFINDYPKDSFLYKFSNIVVGSLFYLIMSPMPVILIGIVYFGLALVTWRQTPAAKIMLGFTATGLAMLPILFFMSMAGTPRYVFITVLFINAMHPFAYCCFMQSRYVDRSEDSLRFRRLPQKMQGSVK